MVIFKSIKILQTDFISYIHSMKEILYLACTEVSSLMALMT